MDVISTHPDDSFIGAVPGRHWHALDDGRVQCDVCPRECKLQEGQRGLCFVRARHGNQVVLTTYGRSSGFCIDPVEKKPLNHFLPGTPILSFGTAGCNLTCKFCQNWDISKSRSFDKLADQASPEAIARNAERLGTIIEELLSLSSLEAGRVETKREAVEVARVVAGADAVDHGRSSSERGASLPISSTTPGGCDAPVSNVCPA